MDRKALRELENARIADARAESAARRERDKGMVSDALARRAVIAARRASEDNMTKAAETARAEVAARKVISDAAARTNKMERDAREAKAKESWLSGPIGCRVGTL